MTSTGAVGRRLGGCLLLAAAAGAIQQGAAGVPAAGQAVAGEASAGQAVTGGTGQGGAGQGVAGVAPALTTEQQTRFDAAAKDFSAGRFAAALAGFRRLMEEQPGNRTIAKYAAEAAIGTGDTAFAVETVRPLAERDPEDWQALGILAHAYAQSGQGPLRDQTLAKLRALHARAGQPFAGRRDVLIETVTAGDRKVSFFPALAPWGPYHVHLMARVYDQAGKQQLRVTLESGDVDQPLFAQQHPQEAARGLRSYSLDGYAEDQRGAKGELIQTHYTYGFYEGEPSYDTVRADILAFVAGTKRPVSSRVGPVQ